MRKYKNVFMIIAIMVVLAINLKTTFDSNGKRYDIKLGFLTAMAEESGSGFLSLYQGNGKKLKTKMCSDYVSYYSFCAQDIGGQGNCEHEEEVDCPINYDPIGSAGDGNCTGHFWTHSLDGSKCVKCGMQIPCNHNWVETDRGASSISYQCSMCKMKKTEDIDN